MVCFLLCLQILILVFFFHQLMAEERGLTVDFTGFNIAMDEARERSRNAQTKVVWWLLDITFFLFNCVFIYIYMNMMKRKN